ncbi:hypothetical protein DLM45_09425 [Hyphomicrobium methylovorum]|uniref:hypothetical protein n=1 Tax=Hyphomicrobium methylovorum TaxID=84 RepID=UPI0015E7A5A7|nr:hypothetical protein [Hyphomicrobium methylovorum]MBA2126438.1 hypothetical protein [Hyphomicrobium methylovorum]
MPLRPSLPLLLLALLSALAAMVIATSATRKAEAATAAAIFAVILISAALRTNAPIWRRAASTLGITQRDALMQTTQITMIAYLWCALAFYAIYLGTPIRWQHGWEYGTAMLAVAAGYAFYLWRLSDPADAVSKPRAIERAVRFASVQAILIGIGLVWLISSGKLSSLRGDWPANQLFIAGGFTVMVLSVIVIKTHASLNDRSTR